MSTKATRTLPSVNTRSKTRARTLAANKNERKSETTVGRSNVNSERIATEGELLDLQTKSGQGSVKTGERKTAPKRKSKPVTKLSKSQKTSQKLQTKLHNYKEQPIKRNTHASKQVKNGTSSGKKSQSEVQPPAK